MPHNKHAVILAALLHDIGKFKWRSTALQPGCDHETFSEEIFNEFIAHKKCVEPISDEVRNLIKHHDNPILSVINRADHLDEDSNRKEEENTDGRRPLISVLSQIELKRKLPRGIYYYKPKKLSMDDIFPEKMDSDITSPWKAEPEEMRKLHEALYQQFVSELRLLPDTHLESYIDTLLFLYEKYLCYVTSAAYKNVPDISLFDHNKTVAALASCYNECENMEESFLIIAADLSGIQNFIYNDYTIEGLDTGGKARRLRGKSFYLSLVTDTLSDYLLRAFGVSRTNLLINGGGHFIMIVPNNTVNVQKFASEKDKIQKWFYRSFRGSLNVILESITANESLYKDYPTWHNKISHKLLKSKRQNSIQILDEVFGINLDEYDYSDFSSPVNDPEFKNLNSYEKMIASLHNLYTDIGEVLPKTRFMLEVVSDSFTGGKHTPFIVNFRGFHTNWIFLKDEKELEQFLNDIEKSSLESLKIYSINNTGITTYLSDVNNLGMNVINRCPFPVSLGFRFIGKSTPMQNGSIMEFGEIARLNAEEGKELDYELLGILRMDVDNLGSIFSFGLKRNEDKDSIESLSRIVNLSRDLNLFFLGYLNKIAEGKRIYITYSGGDDLFVVGSWINIISFALEVKEKFTRFACLNDNVTISGGVYLSKPSFPIGKSARFAGEKESLAKSKSSEKDRISVFDRVLKWDELKELLDYAKQLDALVKTDNKKEEIKSSYLHFLLTQTTETLNEDGTINYDKYFSKLPKIKYSLARRDVHAQGIKGKDGKIKENVRLLSKIINDDPHKYYENFIVPASYVILKNRKSQ